MIASSASSVTGARTWLGADHSCQSDWIITLERGLIAELGRAAESYRRIGLQLHAATPDDFALPTLDPLMREIERELRYGRGFVLLRGLNVND